MKNLICIMLLLVMVISFVQAQASTDIFKAVKSGEIEKVKQVLQKDPNINVKDKDGWAPLHWAVVGKNAEIIRFLLDNRCDVNAQTLKELKHKKKKYPVESTPLDIAIISGDKNTAKLLKDYGGEQITTK